MRVGEIMTKGVVYIRTEDALKKAAELMRDKGIGAVVARRGPMLAGVITDRDIVVRALAKGRNPNLVPVGEVMSSQPVTCREDQDIEEAARLMREKQVRRLLVVDRNGSAVGLVSLGDVALHGLKKQAAEALQRVSEPVHAK